jgi:allantoin racemase
MARIAFLIGDYPGEERERREKVALSYATDDIQVGIVPVVGITAYQRGNSPAELQLVAPAFIEAFRRAEAEGYDAAVPLGALDLAVDAARSVVDIPIVGPAEAMLHIASLLGDRFGVLVYSETSLVLCRRIVKRYEMSHKVVGWRSCGIALPDIAGDRDRFLQAFVGHARDLVEKDGAEVLLPMGITQCPVHVKPDWLSERLGVPVVEGIGAPIRLAAMLAGLNLRHSRKHWPRSPNFPVSPLT